MNTARIQRRVFFIEREQNSTSAKALQRSIYRLKHRSSLCRAAQRGGHGQPNELNGNKTTENVRSHSSKLNLHSFISSKGLRINRFRSHSQCDVISGRVCTLSADVLRRHHKPRRTCVHAWSGGQTAAASLLRVGVCSRTCLAADGLFLVST